MSMKGRGSVILCTFLLCLGLAGGYWAGSMHLAEEQRRLGEEVAVLEAQLEYVSKPEYIIGIAYPFSGRLDWWSEGAAPIIEAAMRDVQDILNEMGSKIRIRFILADSGPQDEGPLEATRSLVEQGAHVIVGLPTSGELEGALDYIDEVGVPVISPASTASRLSRPDCVYRLSTPENYRARVGAELGLKMSYKRVVVLYRDDQWGPGYAETVQGVFKGVGLEAHGIAFKPSHVFYANYSGVVREAEQLVAGHEEDTLVYMVAWENEDYSILNEARRSPALSECRWFTAALYPSIIEETAMFGMAHGIRDFAVEVGLWAPEQRPIIRELTTRLMETARAELGEYPSYEHVYLYDAIMVAANALMEAGGDREDLNAAIPLVASHYYGTTGLKALDSNGDLMAEDTAFIGVCKEDGYKLAYYAYHDGLRNEFTILQKAEERPWYFSPEA